MAQKLDRSYFGTGNRKTATGTNKKDTSGTAETVQKLNRSHFNKPESAPTVGASSQKKTAPVTAPAKKQGSLPMDNVGRKNTANSRLLQDIQKREPRDTGNTPSFADRVTNTIKGGAKSSAAAYTNVGGVLAEGAGYLNTRIANQNAGAALQSDHDAVKQYEKMLRDVKWADGKPMTAVDVQQVQKYLSAAKRRIAAHEGYTKAVEQSDKEVADKAYRKADELAGSAQADLERAKEGAGFLGNMLVDAGASMTQTGLDAIPSILTGGALASQMLGPICRRISYFSIIAVILSGFLVKFTAICYIRGVWCYNDIVPQSVDFSYRQIHHSAQKELLKCVPPPPIKPVIFILAVLWIMNFPTPAK